MSKKFLTREEILALPDDPDAGEGSETLAVAGTPRRGRGALAELLHSLAEREAFLRELERSPLFLWTRPGTVLGDVLTVGDGDPTEPEVQDALARLVEVHFPYWKVFPVLAPGNSIYQRLWSNMAKPALCDAIRAVREQDGPALGLRAGLVVALARRCGGMSFATLAGLQVITAPGQQALRPSRPYVPGPTVQARAHLYKSIKDKTPHLSYVAVAMHANYQEKADVHTEDTVRNAYRAMGWTWERADRIR